MNTLAEQSPYLSENNESGGCAVLVCNENQDEGTHPHQERGDHKGTMHLWKNEGERRKLGKKGRKMRNGEREGWRKGWRKERWEDEKTKGCVYFR